MNEQALILLRDHKRLMEKSHHSGEYMAWREKRDALLTSSGLSEIKSALDLPDDTPEPLVGLIWGLQQRIEVLEQMDRPWPLAGGEEMDKLRFPNEAMPLMIELSKASCDRIISGPRLRDWIDRFQWVWRKRQ